MATLETLEMSGTGDGNNKIPRAVPGAHWCFTWNNYSEEDLATLETNFKKEIKTNKLFQYLFSREVGEKCGTPHLQGWISTGDPKIKIRPNEKFKTMKNGINLVRWEKTKGSKEDNVKYCTKSGGEMHSNVTLLKDPLKGLELYEYQKEILNLINTEPDNRSIYWYWEQTGNLGKTTLAKHICMNHKALYVNGKAADIKSAIVTELKEGRDAPKIVLFGYPRTSEDYVSYASLEEVKDGLFFSGKYESGMWDPDITGAGHQPLFFDQMAAIYDQYTVIGSRLIVDITPATAHTSASLVGIYKDDDTTTGNTTEASMVGEQPSGYFKQMALNQVKPMHFTSKWSAKKTFGPGAMVGDLRYQGTAANNPTEQTYWTLGIQNLNLVSNAQYLVSYKIEYIAVWTELKDIPQS